MPKVLNFKVLIETDEDGYFVATVPAIPGCHTQGKTYEEAINMVREAIELCLEEAEENEDYRSLIDFPSDKQEESFFGVVNMPVSSKFAY